MKDGVFIGHAESDRNDLHSRTVPALELLVKLISLLHHTGPLDQLDELYLLFEVLFGSEKGCKTRIFHFL